MNTDIRLSVGFTSHPKTVKLIRRLGHEGVFSLIALWTWAARNRNDGVLTGMDEEDVAIAAAWGGEPENLVEALLAVRFLERRGDVVCLHDWADHQPYVVEDPLRRERAQKAALARWGGRSTRSEPSGTDAPDAEEETEGGPAEPSGPTGEDDAPARDTHASRMPDAWSSNAPIPTDPVEEDHTLTSFECVSAPDGPNPPHRSGPDMPCGFPPPLGVCRQLKPGCGHPASPGQEVFPLPVERQGPETRPGPSVSPSDRRRRRGLSGRAEQHAPPPGPAGPDRPGGGKARTLAENAKFALDPAPLAMPGRSGMALLKRPRAADSEVPVMPTAGLPPPMRQPRAP